MVEIAKRRGLDGICITDHDSMGLKEFAAEYSEKTGFPIFVGIEFYSLQGDIVAFGIEDYPKERIPAPGVCRSGTGTGRYVFQCPSIPQ